MRRLIKNKNVYQGRNEGIYTNDSKNGNMFQMKQKMMEMRIKMNRSDMK